MSDEPAQSSSEPTPAATVTLSYTGEVWNVAAGGIDPGAVYLDNFDLQASLDLEQLAGWRNATAFVYALYATGNSVAERIGDINGISNIETGEALRLVEAWIDQGFAEGRGSLRLGLYDVSSEFDAGEVRALFLNPAHNPRQFRFFVHADPRRGTADDFFVVAERVANFWAVATDGVFANTLIVFRASHFEHVNGPAHFPTNFHILQH